ncbi:MAG: AAA family ATPase [Chloroflexi bacterium]|nr:AAA family ATPase [Chloroflexota bacterium]
MNCSNCNSTLPETARFCMQCGQPVTVAPTPKEDDRLTRLTAAVPAPLAEKMRAAKLSGERKVVTALFADVVGSTAMAEQMDAEDWTEMMNGAFDRVSPIIYRYEGTIARLLGDAVLAFYGAPVAHEDDPSRAIRAAIDILEVIREYAVTVRSKYGMDFAMRIGINTGSVVVGDVGSDLKYEYTAMGDAINLAARLQSAARPGSALISQHTHRFAAPLFDFNDLGQIEVKGKSEPIQIYEVVGAKAEPGKLRGLAGLTSPMVGRDSEHNALIALSDKLNGNTGGMALIVGEAGLGKTRLMNEWKSAAQHVHWVEGKCLSYGTRLAYHLLIDLTRALVGVHPAADETATRSALQSLVAEHLKESAPEVFPFLAHILSLELTGADKERVEALDPQTLQNQYRAALAKLLEAMSQAKPLGIILEDIHWADPASVELLTQLFPLVNRHPIALTMLTRPDADAPGWKLVESAREMFKENLTELQLNPLSEIDSRQLVSNLLEIESLPEKIRDVILKKAEGNPFFVEEVIRMLIDTGGIIQQGDKWAAGKDIENVEIPDNLQSLLLARIDRLPEEAKRTLRIASVIGRQFSVNVLEQVMSRLV